MVHVLALLAKAGHGKSTAARYLQEKYGTQTVALAGPLKRVAKAVMGFSDEQLYGTQEQKEAIDPRYGMSARKFLQLLGTEGLRDQYWRDVHIEALLKSLERRDAETAGQTVHVVDDCRFRNEAAFFAEAEDFHGAVIKIVCSDAPVTAAGHASETEIDLVPEEHLAATIITSRVAGPEDLYKKLDWVIETFPRMGPFRRVLQSEKGPRDAA
jgi:hypothetical protein